MRTEGTVELLTKIETNLSESLTNQLSEIRELTRQLIMAEEWDDDDLRFLRGVYRQLSDVGLTLDVYKLSWLKRMKNETPYILIRFGG